MNDFDAAVEWLVQSGRAKSKGDARRGLIEQAYQKVIEAISDPDMRAWLGSVLVGVSGSRAPIPNIANATEGLDAITPGAGAAAQAGIDLVNRTIRRA